MYNINNISETEEESFKYSESTEITSFRDCGEIKINSEIIVLHIRPTISISHQLILPSLGGAVRVLFTVCVLPVVRHRVSVEKQIIFAWCGSLTQHPRGSPLPAEHRGQLGELLLGGFAHILQFLSEESVIHPQVRPPSQVLGFVRGGDRVVDRLVVVLLLQGGHELFVTSQLFHELLILQHHSKLLVLYQLVVSLCFFCSVSSLRHGRDVRPAREGGG